MTAESTAVPNDDIEDETITSARIRWQTVLLCALSLSIGWGTRGNYGHELGAMVPGALTAMAIALISQRADWQRRVAYFGLFGAIGWGFGGSMSFMYEISYTHSGDIPTIIYGFAMLFVIGFLWASLGGAGTGLPAFLTRERLTEFFVPMTVIFATWQVWYIVDFNRGSLLNGDFRHTDRLYWYDTDWQEPLLALIAVLVLASVRTRYDKATIRPPGALPNRYDKATSLIVHLSAGWWISFLLLVDFPDRLGQMLFHMPLGLHMNPPRGDSWAGNFGMFVGMLVYFKRNGLTGLTFVSIVSGLFGGLAFASAALFQSIELRLAWNPVTNTILDTNWHSVLEQSWGFINGIGIAVAMGLAMTRAPRVSDDPPVKRWTEGWAAYFVLIVITYLNLQSNPVDWYKAHAMNHHLFHMYVENWFALAYTGIAVAALILLTRHYRRPIAVVPSTWLGKGQMIYLVFLWMMVIGNFDKALPGFASQRLITEYVIFWNGLFATLLVLLTPGSLAAIKSLANADFRPLTRRACAYGAIGVTTMVFIYFGAVWALWGTKVPGFGKPHYRFGARAGEIPLDKKKAHP